MSAVRGARLWQTFTVEKLPERGLRFAFPNP